VLHPNLKIAAKMFSRIGIYQDVNTLDQMHDNFEDWIAILRGKRKVAGIEPVPMDTPIMMVVDSISKLLAPGEAAGVVDYKDYMSDKAKASKKGVNEGSNMEHAKWHASWARRLPAYE
jgi:hypothetical protein